MKKDRLLSFIISIMVVFLCFGQQKQHKIDSITSLLRQATSDSLMVRHHLELGILKDTSVPKEAEQHFFEALKLLDSNYTYTDQLKNKALANDCLGIIERRRNNYDKAFYYYLNALKIKEQAKDSFKIGRSYHNIAMLYSAKRNYDKAIEYIQKALPIRKKDSLNYAVSLNNYGYILYLKKQYGEALILLDSAKNYYGNHIKITDANTNIARIYTKQKRYNEALNIQKKSLAIYTKNEYLERIAITLKDLAITSRKLKQYNNALQYLDSAQSRAISFGNKKLISTIYRERYRIAKQKKDYQLALKYYKTYKTYEDSIFTSKQSEKIKQLELNYRYEKQALADSIHFETEKSQLVSTAKNLRSQNDFMLFYLLFPS